MYIITLFILHPLKYCERKFSIVQQKFVDYQRKMSATRLKSVDIYTFKSQFVKYF